MSISEFFKDIDNLFLIQVIVSAVCGGLLGLERQMRGKPFGIRTCILVCIGTMLFVKLGSEFAGVAGDPTRVLGQVVTGIGFIGAGVILSREGYIRGITSAAVIWILAAIGASIGLQKFGTAVLTTAFTLVALLILERVEASFRILTNGIHKK